MTIKGEDVYGGGEEWVYELKLSTKSNSKFVYEG